MKGVKKRCLPDAGCALAQGPKGAEPKGGEGEAGQKTNSRWVSEEVVAEVVAASPTRGGG